MDTGFEDLGVQVISEKKNSSGSGFEDLGVQIIEPSSALGAFTRKTTRSAIPIVAGLAGAGRGALLAEEALPGLTPWSGIAGALIGGATTSGLASKVQETIRSSLFPEHTKQLNAEMASDVKQHPVAVAAGGVVPLLFGLKPGIPNVPTALLGGGLGAAGEIIPAVSEGRKVDPSQLVMQTAAGAFLNRPNRIGISLGIPSGLKGQKTTLDTPEIIAARNKQESLTPTNVINSPERFVLREKLANDFYGSGADVKGKRLDIVIGSPASGKSEHIVEPLANKHGSLILDSDKVKDFLVDQETKGLNGLVHKESADIVEGMVLPRAIQNGDNLVLPITGKNFDKVNGLVSEFKDHGYEVHISYVDIPPIKAAKRAISRFNETGGLRGGGRFTDPDYVLNKVGLNPSRTYARLKLEGGADSYAKYSNDVRRGSPPKLIEFKGSGEPIFQTQVSDRRGRGNIGYGSPIVSEVKGTPGQGGLEFQDPLKSERVSRITEAIKSAKPVRSLQESIYSKERGKRLARVLSVREKIGGEAGFHSELGQLKGSLPKSQFESIRSKISQEDIDGLFNDINAAPIDPWDQIHAKGGLSNLLEGKVPTHSELNILNKVFGREFTVAALSKRPFLKKATDLGLDIANLPKSIMASLDLSAPLRQGIFLIGRPRQWIPAFGTMFKQFASEKAFLEVQNQIAQRPTYNLMRQSGLSLTDIGFNLSGREEAFMSRLSEMIPGVRQSNRAYTGFLNKLRADVFDDLLKKGQALGLGEDPNFTRNLADYINAATGRGNLGRLEGSAATLNAMFFSPRLMASRLSLLNPTFYMRLHPSVRQQAIRDLLTFASAGASILGLSKLNGANVGTDPRSADFGKVKVRNTRYDIWGGFQQPIVAAIRMLSGQMVSSTTGREFSLGEGYKATTRADIAMRYLQSKQAPVLSLITTLLQGKTITGQTPRLLVELADRFIPMFIQDMYDVMNEHGAAKGWMAIPGAFGVGIQTYGDLIPLVEKTESGSTSIKFRDQPSLGENIVNKVGGVNVSNIPEEFHADLKRAREFQILRQIEIDKAKKIVLETGKPVRTGNTLVYLKNGIVNTKSFGGESKITPENVLKFKLRTMSR